MGVSGILLVSKLINKSLDEMFQREKTLRGAILGVNNPERVEFH